MFFDHGNQGGAIFAFLALALGLPGWVILGFFVVGWVLTAFPDMAPVFSRDDWSASLRSEDWTYRLSIAFRYDWTIYAKYHLPNVVDSKFVQFCPFFILHRVVDIPAHSARASSDSTYRALVYVLTALTGWGAVLALMLKLGVL